MLSVRLWVNLLLLVVGAALAYIIWYQPQQKAATQRLFHTAGYQANDIYIQRTGKKDIRLRKEHDKWRLTEPAIAAVNQDRVKHLLTILQEPIIATYDPAGKDLSAFGLNPGKIKLTINAEEATFGSTNPVTLNRYILKNNKIYTIREIVYGVLGTSITAILAHRLLPEDYKVVKVDAPELFAKIPFYLWNQIEASGLADMTGKETIIAKIQLSIQPIASESNDLVLESQRSQQIELGILALKPQLVLGRLDLNVKYTFNREVMKTLGGLLP